MNTLQMKSVKWLALAAVALSALALGGCASTKSGSSAVESAATPDYLIGPGDGVNIIVWRNPEVSMSVPVRPDGKITTPLVEDLPAAGKTSTELARDIEKALAKFIQQPVVTVVVTGFVGNLRRADPRDRPGRQAASPAVPPRHVADGRPDRRRRRHRVRLGQPRQHHPQRRTASSRSCTVRLDDLIKDGDISANMPMRPGDILVIPESFF